MGVALGYVLTAVGCVVVGAVGHAYFSNAAAKAVAAIEADFAGIKGKVSVEFQNGVSYVVGLLKKL